VLAHHAGSVKVLHTLRPFTVAMAGEGEFDPFKDLISAFSLSRELAQSSVELLRSEAADHPVAPPNHQSPLAIQAKA
jgi:hypothetical protein